MKLMNPAAAAAIALMLTLTTAANAADAPGGQLNFSLKIAGEPFKATDASEQMRALEQTIEKKDWAQVMPKLHDLSGKLEELQGKINERVTATVNPKELDLWTDQPKEFAWSNILYSYAAGDESDNEQFYVTINKALRDGKPDTKKTLNDVKSMRQALTYIPKYEGLSFRGTRLTPERAAKYYTVGKLANDPAFVSTSVAPEVAFRFAVPMSNHSTEAELKIDKKKLAVVQIVRGKTGRPISMFAHMHAHEQEILFANGTPFVVESVSPVQEDAELGKTIIVVLKEQ